MKRLLILFLLISTVSASDFNVTWIPIKEDIVNKEYLVTVQNLKDEMRTVDMKSFFEDTNFDTSQVHDIQLIEYGSKKFESKVLKKNKLEKEVSHGKITFPSVKSVGKKNNKGTKTFILKFKTPPDGSHGKVGLKIDGKEYHPYWNSTWSNQKKIILTGNTSGSQTDYQLLLNVTYEPEMNPDFSDIRFCNDTDQLSAWLESKVNESYALIWVKFPHTPDNGETEDYWIYYGNSEASACWDGDATFEFFDNFEDGDITDWNDITNYEVVEETLDGQTSKRIKTNICGWGAYKNCNIAENACWDWDYYIQGTDGSGNALQQGANNFIYIDDNNRAGAGGYLGYKFFIRIGGSYVVNYDTGSHTVTAGIHHFKVTRVGDVWTFYVDGDEKTQQTQSGLTSSDYQKLLASASGGRCSSYPNRWDNIRVRKYTSSEPTYTFGDTGYYVDSIYFNSSNSYYNLIDYKGDIAVNHSYYTSDDLGWTAQAVDDDVGFVVTSMGSSEINFIIYESVLDWLQLINLDNSKIYTLQNSSGDIEEHQASGNAVNFTTDLSLDNYEIKITDAVPPTPTPKPPPTTLHDIKLSDADIKSFYYPFMYILFIVIIIGGFMHVFEN